MEDLAGLSIDAFLNRLKDRTPTPGGGAVTGFVGALACALGQMVAEYSVRKDTPPEEKAEVEQAALQLHRVDQILRSLMSEDARAYGRMTAAGKARRERPGDAALEAEDQEAVLGAAAVPMEKAAAASTALGALDAFKQSASRYLLSDLGIAATLADATARTARYTLRVNAPEIADEERREKLMSNMDRMLLHCARRLASIEAFVSSHMDDQRVRAR